MSMLSPRLAFSAEERAFLPAALEILETPPNPLGRTLALSLCVAALAGIGWACFGKVDIVAVASGKFVSHGRTQVVQPFETASIAAILVHPGQSVRIGDALIELDKTAAQAEILRARSDGAIARLDVLRLQAFLDGAATAPFDEAIDASDLERRRAQSQLTAQIAERAGKIASLQQEAAQRRAERQSLQQTADKIEKTIPMVSERSDIRTRAAAMGNVSVLAKLESQQLLVETRSEFEITRTKIAALDAGIASLEQKIAGAEAEMNANAMGEFFRARDRVSAAREALEKAQRRIDLQTLRAPIDGTVQQMHVATLGSVVTPAQQLLSIAPDDDQVEVEAMLDNRDIGFVTKGQGVEIKVDAYPFTRYGLLRGVVNSVDRDAEAAPTGSNAVQGSERAADRTDNVEASERLRYTVHVALQPGALDVDGRPAQLLPGMSVKAEIITGKRRIIDFMLAPLREHMHDGLRER